MAVVLSYGRVRAMSQKWNDPIDLQNMSVAQTGRLVFWHVRIGTICSDKLDCILFYSVGKLSGSLTFELSTYMFIPI